MIKSKLGGRSNSSIENVQEDKFWEVFNRNKVSAKNGKDFSEQVRGLNSAPTRQGSLMSDQSIGNRSMSIKNINEVVNRNTSDASEATELPELEGVLTKLKFRPEGTTNQHQTNGRITTRYSNQPNHRPTPNNQPDASVQNQPQPTQSPTTTNPQPKKPPNTSYKTSALTKPTNQPNPLR